MTDQQAKKLTFKKLICGCPLCIEGALDTGGDSPWGAAIYVKCPMCDGTGKVTAHDALRGPPPAPPPDIEIYV